MAKRKYMRKAAKAGGAKNPSAVADAAREKQQQLSFLSWRPDRRIQPIQARQKPTIGPVEG
jgi:hypothetical protein